MKPRIPFIVLTLASSLFLMACDGGSSAAVERQRQRANKAEKQLQEAQTELANKKREVESLNKELKQQSQRADEAEKNLVVVRNSLQEKLNAIEKLREELKQAKTGKQRYGLVLLFVGLSIVGFGGWLFFPRKAVSSSSGFSATGRPKCPRCGWEHDPGDTVCKNPACKTQF